MFVIPIISCLLFLGKTHEPLESSSWSCRERNNPKGQWIQEEKGPGSREGFTIEWLIP